MLFARIVINFILNCACFFIHALAAVSMAMVNAYFWLRYKRRNILCIWADQRRELFSNWQHDLPRSNGHSKFCEHREACIGIGEHREQRWHCWHFRSRLIGDACLLRKRPCNYLYIYQNGEHSFESIANPRNH